MKHQLTLLSIALFSITLTACGGSSNNTTNTNNTANPDSGKTFSDSATWTVNSNVSSLNITMPKVYCYDFNSKAEVSCDTTTWDLKFDTTGRTPSLWSNSGISGKGQGGALGLFKWSELKTYATATVDPVSKQNIANRYLTDTASGIFGTQAWYEYNATNHQLQPNNRVYLITTDSTNPTTTSSVQMPIFAVQIINYYNTAGASGHPTLRWIDTATPNDVKIKTFDASATTQYINLKTGEITTKDGDWHIALNRFNVQLNGGVSGSKKVAGFLAKTPTGYYDDNGKAIADKFNKNNIDESLADLKDIANYKLPTSTRQWVSDSQSSVLNPTYTGSYPNLLDFGWYTYNPTNHKIAVKTEETTQGALLRSGEGNSYARMHLTDIQYQSNEALPNIWKFEFDIQPK
ncbi:HmuY family protein [Faucicola boevrei]|uniref:HmuY family protein n=1 Tax=Faucicola boevrei TaxID=346665 RepID=UPI000360F5E3|nr:HmuY family protein [Moraxella boevrei]